MFLLLLAHPGCPGQNPESHKMVVVVVLVQLVTLLTITASDIYVVFLTARPSTNYISSSLC